MQPKAKTNAKVKDQLKALREAIRQRKLAKLQAVQKVKAMHAKQAAYTRDVVQRRPKGAAYATEAEKLMGARSGYYAKPKPKAVPGFGEVSNTEKAVADLQKATELVKRISKDVAMGVVPKSDLTNAMKDLNKKALRAQKLSNQFSGTSDESPVFHMVIIAVLLYLVFVVLTSK